LACAFTQTQNNMLNKIKKVGVKIVFIDNFRH
jgi:hypothetical protein